MEESGKKVEVGGPGQGGVLEQLVEDQDNQKYLFFVSLVNDITVQE